MWSFLLLASVLSIIANCEPRRNYDRPIIEEQSRYTYEDIDNANYRQPHHELAREPSQVQYYKTPRRPERVPAYQYAAEENTPVDEYTYTPKRYQKVPDNYPYHRDIEQIIRSSHYGRLAKKPIVEQYLKEVTPTTKTTYNQRPASVAYQQPQSVPIKHPQQDQIEETRNLQQIPIQYVLRTDLQQQQKHATPEPTQQYEAIEEPAPAKPKQAPGRNFNLVAYQNALLAHQKLLESAESATDGPPSRSAIYVQQNIPKTTPVHVKAQQIQAVPSTRQPQAVVLPDPTEYYRPKVPVYDAPVRYQARIPYQKEETEYQEQNDEPEEKQRPVQYFQVKQARYTTKSRQPAKFRPEASDFQADHVYDYQPVKQAPAPAPTRAVRLQYSAQHPAQVSTRQPEKYLPEYEQSEDETEYQRKLPTADQLSSIIYQRAKVAKYQSEKDIDGVPYQIQYTKEPQDYQKLQQQAERYRAASERRRNEAPKSTAQTPKYYYRNRYAIYDEN